MARRTDLKLPYGVSDFKTIRNEGLYYVDKTMFLAKPEMELARGYCYFCLFPERVYNGDVRGSNIIELKYSKPDATDAEIAADLTAAGYPATVENTDEVAVDLKASGMLKPDRDNRILFDFTEPPDAIQVRDRVVTTNAVVLGVTAEYARRGVVVVVK